jgi:hypothetical protein
MQCRPCFRPTTGLRAGPAPLTLVSLARSRTRDQRSPMPISVSLDALFRQLIDRGRASREQVADYLDAVAVDARLLADYWENRLVEERRHEARALRKGRSTGPETGMPLFGNYNTAVLVRLEHTYRDATLAFRGRLDAELQDLFMSHLARLLQQRGRVKEEFDRVAAELRFRGLVSLDGDVINIGSLASLTETLHGEAAAIEVLARRFRATM